MAEDIGSALYDVLASSIHENLDGSAMNIVDGVSEGLHAIARALKLIGLADAGTFGAVEALSVEVKEGSTRIADGLHAIAEAINNHGG